MRQGFSRILWLVGLKHDLPILIWSWSEVGSFGGVVVTHSIPPILWKVLSPSIVQILTSALSSTNCVNESVLGFSVGCCKADIWKSAALTPSYLLKISCKLNWHSSRFSSGSYKAWFIAVEMVELFWRPHFIPEDVRKNFVMQNEWSHCLSSN